MSTGEEKKNLTQEEAAVPAPGQAVSETPLHESKLYAWLAVFSLLLCVASWFAATVGGVPAIILGVAAIVAGAWALKSRRHVVRNTAITAIIAVAVLIVVVAAFIITLHHFLG